MNDDTAVARPPPQPEAEIDAGPRRSATRRALGPVGALRSLFGWPRGQWPAPTITMLLAAAVLLVGAVELLPPRISDVTLSIRARTEVLEIVLDPARTYVWWLPAGGYSLLTAQNAPGCEQRNRFDVACRFADATAITIKNGGTARLEVLPPDADGSLEFSLTLTPRKDGARAGSTFEVHGADDALLVATPELVTFESAPVDVWRIPLVLTRAQIGESLTDSISTADTIGATRQPIMTEGDVRIFARGLGSRDRYLIQEERFDPADVVQVPADPSTDGLLLGVLSLDRADERHAFDVTMHTALAEVFVRRLGGEHRIGVSTWSIVSQLPTWAAFWVVLVSLIVVANYHAARLQQLQGLPHDEKKLA